MVGAVDLSPHPHMRLQASTLGLASPHPGSLLSVLSPEAMKLRQALSQDMQPALHSEITSGIKNPP